MSDFRLVRDPLTGIYSQIEIPEDEICDEYRNNNVQNVIPVVQLPLSKKEIHDRAWSSEAELLHYFARTAPDFKANDYQKKIMEKYQKGIESVDAHYVGREYDGVFPPFPVNVNSFR